MSIYAEVQNGLVVNIIVADADFITSHPQSSSFYLLDENEPFAIGDVYDAENDTFVSPVQE